MSKPLYLFISLAIIALDQWTKWLVEAHLPRYVSEPIIPGFLNLTHVKNTGVAFGLFAESGAAGGTWILIAVGCLALVAVIAYFMMAPARNRLLLTALALVVGGAIGNLIDRIARGAVTDFVDVYVGAHHWPAFNVADSAITVGICLLIIDSFRSYRAETAAEAAKNAEETVSA